MGDYIQKNLLIKGIVHIGDNTQKGLNMEDTTHNATRHRRDSLQEEVIYRRNNIKATTYKRNYIEKGLKIRGIRCRGEIKGNNILRELIQRQSYQEIIYKEITNQNMSPPQVVSSIFSPHVLFLLYIIPSMWSLFYGYLSLYLVSSLCSPLYGPF